MSSNPEVKILFRFYSDILHQWTVETMWANVIDEEKGLYKIDNIPFYVPLIASDDIVQAEYKEDEQMLVYQKTVQHSGNSTIAVVILNKSWNVEEIREIFKSLGCESEGVNEQYFSMEVHYDIDYALVKSELVELERKEIIEHTELFLSEKHRRDFR